MLNKHQFFSKPKYRGLSKQQKESRWKAYAASNNNNPNPRTRRPSRGNGGRTQRVVDPSEQCARDYAKVLINPFDAPPACLPWPPALRSRKIKSWAKGSFYAQDGALGGTAGFGFIAVKPTMAGDNGFVLHSNTSSTTTNINTGLGTTVVTNNSSHNNADFTTDAVSGRIVSVGLKIRWAGTTLNMNGSAVGLEHPSHQSLLGNTTHDLRAWDRAKLVPITRDWTAITWQPVRPGDYSFTEGTAQPSGSDHYNLVIGITTGTQPGELGPFEYEAIINYELVGNDVQGTTLSYTAVDSTSKIITAVSQVPNELVDRVANSTAMGGFSTGVGSLLSQAIPALGGYAFQRLTGAGRPALM